MTVKRKPRSTRDIEMQIGARVCLRRLSLGMLQVDLARAIGKGDRQVEKYESGRNRISGRMLFLIAEALDVPVDYFFEEIGNMSQSPSHKRMMLYTLHNFVSIRNERQCGLLLELAKSMVSPSPLEVVAEPMRLPAELEAV